MKNSVKSTFSSRYKYCAEVSSADDEKDGLILYTGIRPSFLLSIGRMLVSRHEAERNGG